MSFVRLLVLFGFGVEKSFMSVWMVGCDCLRWVCCVCSRVYLLMSLRVGWCFFCVIVLWLEI